MKNFPRTLWQYFLALFALIAACLVIANWHVDEPKYEGKRLSAWMDELATEPENLSESETLAFEAQYRQMFTNVVRSIGVDALPCYLEWIKNAPQPTSAYERFSDWIAQISRYRIHLPKRQDRLIEATAAIEVLGPTAEPAIGHLEHLLYKEWLSGTAARCLAAIGSNSVPVLINAVMTSSNDRVRYDAVRALGDLAVAARPAKSMLLQLVQKEKPSSFPGLSTADLALRALVEVDLPPDELLPLLREQLLATNAAAGAAYGLARLGNAETSYLMEALTNQNGRIRASAKAALDLQNYLENKSPAASALLFEHFNVKFNNSIITDH